jgi:hypothetical protein
MEHDKPVKCIKCNDNPCICCDDVDGSDLWAAHCMSCDNNTGDGDGVHYKHLTESEALNAWNAMNRHD